MRMVDEKGSAAAIAAFLMLSACGSQEDNAASTVGDTQVEAAATDTPQAAVKPSASLSADVEGAVPRAPNPAQVMARPSVDKALRELLKEDYSTYAAMLAEPGKGKVIGPDYYGSACLLGDCDAGYATLYVDGKTGATYAAWTENGNLHFRPEIEQWPEKAQEAYEFWPEN